MRCLINQAEIRICLLSIDQLGNIIVSDSNVNQIKIFSKEGEILHVTTRDMLPGDQEFNQPTGVSIDEQNQIIVGHNNKKCNLSNFKSKLISLSILLNKRI